MESKRIKSLQRISPVYNAINPTGNINMSVL